MLKPSPSIATGSPSVGLPRLSGDVIRYRSKPRPLRLLTRRSTRLLGYRLLAGTRCGVKTSNKSRATTGFARECCEELRGLAAPIAPTPSAIKRTASLTKSRACPENISVKKVVAEFSFWIILPAQFNKVWQLRIGRTEFFRTDGEQFPPVWTNVERR